MKNVFRKLAVILTCGVLLVTGCLVLSASTEKLRSPTG